MLRRSTLCCETAGSFVPARPKLSRCGRVRSGELRRAAGACWIYRVMATPSSEPPEGVRNLEMGACVAASSPATRAIAKDLRSRAWCGSPGGVVFGARSSAS
jgi:hypothetical protein